MNAKLDSSKCRIIANLGDNHNGDPDLARQLAELASSAGCDAIVVRHRKVLCGYTQEALLQPAIDGSHTYSTLGEALRGLELAAETLETLRNFCRGRLDFIAAPHDLDAFAELQSIEPDAYQVEPPVLGHVPLLKAISSTGRPVLLVAGSCAEEDISAALTILDRQLVTLMHCVFSEGVPLESTALSYIPYYANRFNLPVGYMGLEKGTAAAIAAFGMGARTIEKVFTSDRHLPGGSHKSSLDRDEMRYLVECLRGLDTGAVDVPPRILLPEELANAEGQQASLAAAQDLDAGVTLEESMLSVKLATSGVRPGLIDRIVGRRLAYDVPADTPITFGVLEA